ATKNPAPPNALLPAGTGPVPNVRPAASPPNRHPPLGAETIFHHEFSPARKPYLYQNFGMRKAASSSKSYPLRNTGAISTSPPFPGQSLHLPRFRNPPGRAQFS